MLLLRFGTFVFHCTSLLSFCERIISLVHLCLSSAQDYLLLEDPISTKAWYSATISYNKCDQVGVGTWVPSFKFYSLRLKLTIAWASVLIHSRQVSVSDVPTNTWTVIFGVCLFWLSYRWARYSIQFHHFEHILWSNLWIGLQARAVSPFILSYLLSFWQSSMDNESYILTVTKPFWHILMPMSAWIKKRSRSSTQTKKLGLENW